MSFGDCYIADSFEMDMGVDCQQVGWPHAWIGRSHFSGFRVCQACGLALALAPIAIMIVLRAKMRMLLSLAVVAIAISSCSLMGCNVPLGSYPYFWDYTKTRPQDADLVGTYKLLELRLPSDVEHSVREKAFTITLNEDHTATLTDVPEFDGFGQKLVCRLSGTATWALDDGINSGWGWSVAFQNYHPLTKPTAHECDLQNSIWGILVLGRHTPYRLYAIVGDPYIDTGVEYERIAR